LRAGCSCKLCRCPLLTPGPSTHGYRHTRKGTTHTLLVGGWLNLVAGSLLVLAGCWLVAGWLMVAGCWLRLFAGRWLVAGWLLASCWLVAAWLLAGCCLVTGSLLARCKLAAGWLLTASWLLAAGWWLGGCWVVAVWLLVGLGLAAAGTHVCTRCWHLAPPSTGTDITGHQGHSNCWWLVETGC
jgi:hypothetical protein